MVNIGIMKVVLLMITAKYWKLMKTITIYDINPKLYPDENVKLETMYQQDIIFISVPLLNPDGSCCLNILENIINDLEKM